MSVVDVCVCVSICGCKVGWNVQESVSVWTKGGEAWSLRSNPLFPKACNLTERSSQQKTEKTLNKKQKNNSVHTGKGNLN